MNETLKTLKERRSIRKYQTRQVSDSDLDAILEAGTWAACGRGIQSAVMVVVQDSQTIAKMSRLNAEIWGKPEADPFFGAPTVVVVLGDTRQYNWVKDGSLVMGNLMNAAWSLQVGSCWVNRAQELFEQEEGKALLRQWGLPEYYAGVGNCVLGYIDGDIPAPKQRKEDYIIRA